MAPGTIKTKTFPLKTKRIIYARQIECPVCHAKPGEFCRATLFNGKVKDVSSHGPRVRLAEDAQRAFDELTG